MKLEVEPVQTTIELADAVTVEETEIEVSTSEEGKVNDLEAVVTNVESETTLPHETETEQSEKPAPTVKVKKATSATKKAPNKDKKLARQVKKANRLSGHASSPMKKTETITTINEIPTSFMASEDRIAHQVSGRTAISADAISRSSAAMTNPSL